MAIVLLTAPHCVPQDFARAATRVDLVIDEPFTDRRAAWPITTGVPFPRGKLISDEHCRLIDDRGQERPLQARVATTWEADRKSVRWLTIDFVAEPGRKYSLKFGDDIMRATSATKLAESRDEFVTVSTGALLAEFSTAGAAVLRTISADLNGDGQTEPDELVVAGAVDGEHFYLDQTGQRFSSAKDGIDRRVVLESTGPVRACVRVDGFYTGPKGERIAQYRTRYHFFAGLLPNYEVYLHRLTIPAMAPAGHYVFTPKLELAVLDWNTSTPPIWNAAQPLSLKLGEAVWLAIAADEPLLKLESAEAAFLRLRDRNGQVRIGKVSGNSVTFELKESRPDMVRIEMPSKPGWFRVVERPESSCWVTPAVADTSRAGPDFRIGYSDARRVGHDLTQSFIPGRFGSAVQIVPKQALHIPDQVVIDSIESPLFDERQGTIEFWVRKQWEERLTPIKLPNLLPNGVITVPLSNKLKLEKWTHVALVWAPYRGDPERTITYTYIDGRDSAFYRSANWDGYSSARPSSGPKTAKRLMEFVSRVIAGTAFSIDELRISNLARYADLQVEYGPQQTFNPVRFDPTTEPF